MPGARSPDRAAICPPHHSASHKAGGRVVPGSNAGPVGVTLRRSPNSRRLRAPNMHTEFPATQQLSRNLGLITSDYPKQLEAFLATKLHEMPVKVNIYGGGGATMTIASLQRGSLSTWGEGSSLKYQEHQSPPPSEPISLKPAGLSTPQAFLDLYCHCTCLLYFT